MAVPIITGVDVLYPQDRGYKLPGEIAEVHVFAVDADSHPIELEVTVRDTGTGQAATSVMVLQSDPLTYEASTTTLDHTVTQDPLRSHVFFVT